MFATNGNRCLKGCVLQRPKHDIKHYGTFGSPKLPKHAHFDQNPTWEREWEHAWELANAHGIVYGDSIGNVGT
jgi:hypothetical protein